jgi:acetolactate synthase-1/2/3 large subunit
MRGTEAVARILKAEGVEYHFSYPNHPLIDAAAQVGIRPILARGEKTLINMADGYARATNRRRPSVLVVQSGPGIENAFGGLAQAYADSVPLLIIPGGPDIRRLGESSGFNPLPVYQHITKWSGRINVADRISDLSRRAFSQLRNGPPGPVLLELPSDVGNAQIDESTFHYSPPRAYRSAGDPSDIAEAARLLIGAKRPVLHAGHGVLWAEAWDELLELSELMSVPVMTTMAAKSAFPENHPLSLGTGANTITGMAAEFLAKADLVVGVGCSFSRGGFSTSIPAGKRIVHLTADPNELDKHASAEVAVVGDSKLVLRQLIDEIRHQSGARSNDAVRAEIHDSKERFLSHWKARLTDDATPINPYRVIWDLMNTVDRQNTIVTHDSGNPRDQMIAFFEALIPRGYIGWGKSTQLGTGFGVALGAKLAHPERLVVNVMGDLAFGTAGMEVETAVRERLPIMTVLLNNSVMGGYGHHMPTASERYGSNRLSGDYSAVAKGLGAHAERVERADDVVAAIQRGVAATRAGKPVLLEMITKEEPIFPVTTQMLKDAAELVLARA